jgi:hypothetical protein
MFAADTERDTYSRPMWALPGEEGGRKGAATMAPGVGSRTLVGTGRNVWLRYWGWAIPGNGPVLAAGPHGLGPNRDGALAQSTGGLIGALGRCRVFPEETG